MPLFSMKLGEIAYNGCILSLMNVKIENKPLLVDNQNLFEMLCFDCKFDVPWKVEIYIVD